MAKTSPRNPRLAGGSGTTAAVQNPEVLLRRSVMAALLWENIAYESGGSVAANIASLIPQVNANKVAEIALEARDVQKLRHVPLFIAVEMLKYDTHRSYVGYLLPQIIRRPDELAETLALYWRDGKVALAKQLKLGLAKAFTKFDEYQFAKWEKDTGIKIRDVMFMVHPTPNSQIWRKDNTKAERKRGEFDPDGELFAKIASRTLATPDTWEVRLSSGQDKKAAWEELITTGKLPPLAFLRNLRNMELASVNKKIIAEGLAKLNTKFILPINVLAAVKAAPNWERELEGVLLRLLADFPKLPGWTVLIVDVSGSMQEKISTKSDFNRLHVGGILAMMTAEVAEHVSIYLTAGNDNTRVHQTKRIPASRGFALLRDVESSLGKMGGGGIFTRQALEYVYEEEESVPDRIIVYSDSQDCDWPNAQTPNPFGVHNYIVDVSANSRGVNYAGLWTAEISGWSEGFLRFIAGIEGLNLPEEEAEEE